MWVFNSSNIFKTLRNPTLVHQTNLKANEWGKKGAGFSLEVSWVMLSVFWELKPTRAQPEQQNVCSEPCLFYTFHQDKDTEVLPP